MRLITGILCVLVISSAFSCSPPREAGVGGAEAVKAEVFDIDSGILDRLLEGGGRVLLAFWTTRCPYCVQSIPALNAFYGKHGGELAMVGVNIGESAERVGNFAERRGVAYPVGLDRDGSLARKFNIRGVPAYVLLGPGGDVEYHGHSLEEMKAAAGL